MQQNYTPMDKTFKVGEFCHHRHEAHEPRLAFDNASYQCSKCGYYFNSKPKEVTK